MTRQMIFKQISKLLKSAGDLPPERWPGSDLEQHLKALKADVDKEMIRKEKTILGEEQLSWIEKQVRMSVHNGIKWRLIAQPLVTQERMSPDYERAISKATESSDADRAAKWQFTIRNATGVADSVLKRMFLSSLAAGRYRINLSFDDWMGYIADRMRLAAALQPGSASGNLIYGGDTHNAWAGLVRNDAGEVVASEFDGMSVSSAGLEVWQENFPHDLEAAAWEASNADLLWADTHSRGFMLVNLAQDTQRIEYRGVDVRTANDDNSWCLAAFEVTKSAIAAPRRVSCSGSTKQRDESTLMQAWSPAPSFTTYAQNRYAPVSRHRSQVALRRGSPTR
jgi:phosphodiesterase/alkaline phosphatase D-like protein